MIFFNGCLKVALCSECYMCLDTAFRVEYAYCGELDLSVQIMHKISNINEIFVCDIPSMENIGNLHEKYKYISPTNLPLALVNENLMW